MSVLRTVKLVEGSVSPFYRLCLLQILLSIAPKVVLSQLVVCCPLLRLDWHGAPFIEAAIFVSFRNSMEFI